MANKPTDEEVELRRQVEGRLLGLRVNRYSWWTHWRELADFLLPRRYKWLITPNQMARGSPINQHILDSTGTLAARKCSAGMMSGISSPTSLWFRLKIANIDSTQTSPISLWLAICERMMMMVFQASNFYNSLAVLYFDLVVFGTATMIIYEDYDNVINCVNPCLGEYYLDIDGKYRPCIFYREFTFTIASLVDEFGIDNVSDDIARLYREGGPNLTRELIVAHAIEPNNDGKAGKFGIPADFAYREVYWQWGGSTSPQGGMAYQRGFLRKRGFHEAPHIAVRWDVVSNDAYGRSPGMDALPDVRQLQQEVRRKAQAIDKQVNPPMVADIQLKNQPASLLPGGVTYVSGMTTGKVGFAPVYQVQPDLKGMLEDLNEVRDRIKTTFFNDLFQIISQFETRSNVSATEIDARRAEGLVLLGPVLDRLQFEGLGPIIDRTFNIMARSGLLPPAPPEIAGQNVEIEYVSILAQAQTAKQASGIERLLQLAGGLAGVDPAVMDNIDIDYLLAKYSSLMNNDPRLIRSPEQLTEIRLKRQQEAQAQQQAEMAEKMAAGAKTLSETEVGGGENALQRMIG